MRNTRMTISCMTGPSSRSQKSSGATLAMAFVSVNLNYVKTLSRGSSFWLRGRGFRGWTHREAILAEHHASTRQRTTVSLAHTSVSVNLNDAKPLSRTNVLHAVLSFLSFARPSAMVIAIAAKDPQANQSVILVLSLACQSAPTGTGALIASRSSVAASGAAASATRTPPLNTKLNGTEPILCAPVICQVDRHLIELLTSLHSAEWDLPTIAPQWSVRDVAAHLLDTALRKLSIGRDKCHVEPVDVRSHQDVVTLVISRRRRCLPPPQPAPPHSTHATRMHANSRFL